MDLEYWIDYTQLFGVKELIPLYDKMDIVTYHNWDVYVINWAIFFGTIYFWKKVIGLVCGCCACCSCCGCCKKKA